MIHVTWTNFLGCFLAGCFAQDYQENDHSSISLGLALETIGEALCIFDHTLSLHTILYCQQYIFQISCM